MPPNILHSPSDFSAGHFAGWFFTLYAGLLVAVADEDAVDWHFGHLRRYRRLAFLPSARQRMLDDEARRRVARPTRASREAPRKRARTS